MKQDTVEKIEAVVLHQTVMNEQKKKIEKNTHHNKINTFIAQNLKY